MEDKLNQSPAVKILNLIWMHTPYKSHEHLNRTMQDALMSVINAGIRFDKEDFDFVHKSFRPGYWMGKSTNGNHYGEHYYSSAAVNNPSCIIAWESYYKRTAFIVDGKRMSQWMKFKFEGLFCHVTGWNEDNDKLQAVGYDENFDKGKRKLLSWTKKEWLEIRKNIEII